jgi:hypothetical protein
MERRLTQVIWIAAIGVALLAQPVGAQVRVPAPPVLVTPPLVIPSPPISPPSLEIPVMPAPSAPPAVTNCPDGASVGDCPGDRRIQKNEGMGVLGPSIAR